MIFKSKICLTNRGKIRYNGNITDGDRGIASPDLVLITSYGCKVEAVIFYLLYFFRLLK